MLDLAVQRKIVRKANNLTIDPGSYITGPPQFGEEVFVLPLLPADDRCQHQERRTGGYFVQDPRHDLLAGLSRHGTAAVGAMPLPHPGIKHPQIVVDLGDRADRRPRIAPAGLLLDRDRRAQAIDPIDLRLGHLAQELASIAREAFDIAPLTLGVERVKR